MTITRRLSRRPITEDKHLQAVNREVVPAIQELIEEVNASGAASSDHEARIVVLEATASDHETRIDAAETLLVNHETRIDTLESTSSDHETRIDALETTSSDHETRLDVLEAALPTLTVETISGTTYTLVLADAWKLKQTTNGSAVTITVPANATVAFPVGTQVHFEQNGAGTLTLSAAGGVTLDARVGLSSAGQYGALTITKTSTNRWLVTGDMA